MAASDGRRGRPWRRLRQQVLDEEPLCHYCRVRPSTTVDHVWPLSKFPELAHVREALVGACKPCNGSKHDRLPTEWRAPVARPRPTTTTTLQW